MAVGIFDSGIGGLTVYKTVNKNYPEMDIHYLGDTARVPYGNRSPETIIRYSLECTSFLVSNFHIDTVIVACNTASSYAIEHIRKKFGINVIGVVEPGAKRAIEVTNGYIGVIGTIATVRSESYVKAVKELNKNIKISQIACPLFVPIVEEMLVDTEIARSAVHHYMDSLVNDGVDTIILGCTHYPFLKNTINSIYPDLKIVDSSEAILEYLEKINLNKCQSGKREIYLTDEAPAFETLKTVLTDGIISQKITL
ncbi:glutamate racemase [uncultured Desulfobacter sp.]|uniref:glutamate racemase n=1 Tax=uncultured Desulfobacter sp. TaxID=240139 RepID=UPI002AAC0974|nr:glutamate racemase [uncultured Desulfobacter sp.]